MPPPRPAPQAPSDDEDPYQLNVSDESSEDDHPAKKKKQPNPIDPQDDGYIPDFWGVRYPNESTTVERDNSLRFMYLNQAYYSKHSNALFVGQSATDASAFERNSYDTYCPPTSNQTYARTIWGIPGSIFELNKLLTLIKDRSDRFRYWEAEEAFLLLRKLYDVSRQVLPPYHDWAMEWIVRPGEFTPDITFYFGCRAIESPRPTIRRIDVSDLMGRPSLQAPPLAESLNIDTYGLYFLLHGQPGSISALSGILMDFTYRINRRTVFGLALARLLNPIEWGTQPIYRRLFACVMALLHRYHEAIMKFDQRNALSPFRPQEGPTFLLSRP